MDTPSHSISYRKMRSGQIIIWYPSVYLNFQDLQAQTGHPNPFSLRNPSIPEIEERTFNLVQNHVRVKSRFKMWAHGFLLAEKPWMLCAKTSRWCSELFEERKESSYKSIIV